MTAVQIGPCSGGGRKEAEVPVGCRLLASEVLCSAGKPPASPQSRGNVRRRCPVINQRFAAYVSIYFVNHVDCRVFSMFSTRPPLCHHL